MPTMDDVRMKVWDLANDAEDILEKVFEAQTDAQLRQQLGSGTVHLITGVYVARTGRSPNRGLNDRTVKPWNRKFLTYLAVRLTLVSLELWRRRYNPVRATAESEMMPHFVSYGGGI